MKCSEHGVKAVAVPWARRGAGFTLLFEAMVMTFALNGMTVNAIGRQVGENDTLIWRILRHYVSEALEKVDMSEVRNVGLDETSRAKWHKYVTIFMDLVERRILFVTEGKGAETVEEFAEYLKIRNGDPQKIQEASLDMSPAFINGVETYLPNAQLTFDQFHLMKLLNEAVDEVRRQEQKDRPELQGSRYVYLKNEWNHTEKQKELFQALQQLDLKTNKAHHLKGVFQDIFTCAPEDGESLLKRWYFWATHSRIQPIIDFAKTIKNHWDGVVRWFVSKINNGILEGMNSLVQAAKARSRGFRNVQNFITMIYLVGGKLKLNLPLGELATHTK